MSAALDSNLLDLFLRGDGTRHRNFEYALVEARLDLLGIRLERELKAAHECAERPLDEMIVFFLVVLFLFRLVLGLQGQDRQTQEALRIAVLKTMADNRLDA